MATLTRERMTLVRQHVASALAAPGDDQLTTQACADTCNLLTDWLASDDWGHLRRRSLGRVGDVFRDAAPAILDQPLADLLTRHDVQAATALVHDARESVTDLARRFPHWRQAQLFAEADSRLTSLRDEVCRLTSQPITPATRGRARKLLLRAAAVIPTIALAMAATSPAQMQQNVDVWGHDAARVVSTFLVAQQAHPEMVIAPPRLQQRPPEMQGPGL